MGKTKDTGYLGNEITVAPGSVGIDSLAGSGTRMVTANATGVLGSQAIGGGSGDVVGPVSSTDNAIARFDLATGKLLQNSVVKIGDTGIVNLPSIVSPTLVAGDLAYNSTNESLVFKNTEADITLDIGQEQWVRVFNNTGSTINNGQAVYINGSDAGTGLPTIALARADVFSTSVPIGIVTHSIETATIGYVTAFGSVRDLNTSSFTSGIIWLSPITAGALTQTLPIAPNFVFRVGHVSVVNVATGVIHVQLGAAFQAGGSTTQVQYNNGGAISGSADFTWDNTNKTFSLLGTDTKIVMKGVTTEPTAPAADTLTYYSKKYAGRMVPKIKGPSGLDTPMQIAFWGNNITMWTLTTITTGVWLGTVGSAGGTYSTQLPTTTNLYTSIKRARYANVVTTPQQILGQRNTEAMFMRGSVAGQGGFFFYARCGFDVWTNGGRFFAGMHTATTVISADPSVLNNTVGFCVDAADNGAISFLTRGTAATKAATGLTIVSNKGYDVYIFCAPNSTEIGWRIVDINTGTEASGTATATLPTNTTLLTAGVLASNAALTPVTSIHLGLNRIYVETDY